MEALKQVVGMEKIRVELEEVDATKMKQILEQEDVLGIIDVRSMSQFQSDSLHCLLPAACRSKMNRRLLFLVHIFSTQSMHMCM